MKRKEILEFTKIVKKEVSVDFNKLLKSPDNYANVCNQANDYLKGHPGYYNYSISGEIFTAKFYINDESDKKLRRFVSTCFSQIK